MRASNCLVVSLLATVVPVAALYAEDSSPSPDVLKGAINKAIPLLEAGSKGSADQRQCFTCHSQAVPVLALAELRRRGFAIDEENYTRQLKHTAAHLERGKQGYLSGAGQGGKALTAGYALWTLEAGGQQPDETTASVVQFLLGYQKDQTHWTHPGSRPPTSGSEFTTTYVVLHALDTFGTDELQPEIKARRTQAGQWLMSEIPRDTEDRVFRLWAMPYVEASSESVEKAIAELIDAQQADGGWAQASDMESDAYATATVLVALLRPGKLSVDHAAVHRGIAYLLSNQREDGSWHVTTRAKGFQPYFESGFPHGKDQFISIAASGWATLALALVLPEMP